MTQRRILTDEFIAQALPEQPSISPDGSQIVYVLRTVNRAADRDERSLWVVSAAGGQARRLTYGTADTAPAWSPDGNHIAFLRVQEGPAQLWVLPLAGGEPEQVSSQPLGAGAPVWSTDSLRIAFTGPIDSAALPGDGTAESTRRRTAPLVTDRLGYKLDGRGFFGTVRSHVHVVTLADRSVLQLTRGDWFAGAPVWSPDGERIAFSAGMEEDTDLTLASAVYVVPTHSAKGTPQLVSALDAQLTAVGWTPDGTGLLAVGRADTEIGNASVFLLPLDGSGHTNLTAALDRNVMPGGPGYPGALPQLTGAATELVFCARDNGYTHLYASDLAGTTVRPILTGDANVSGMAVAGSRAAAIVAHDTRFDEVVLVDLTSGEMTVLTAYSPEEPGVVAPESRSFTISDGTVVHGWLRRDPSLSGPLPLLLDVHGGPHNAWNGAAEPFHAYHHELVSRGWAVLILNPRGSDGYGEDFMRAVLGVWGSSDANDFLEPLDTLVAEGIADPDRLALAGYSYGGYMTCYLTSRDQRFAAAVTGGVVADLTSLAGTSDVGNFLSRLEHQAMPWEDPEATMRQSPYTRVGDVSTPTLIVHGGDDQRCPVGQAEQWFTALREQRVPTELVVYPGGAHGFLRSGKPSHRADWNRRIVDWVVRYAPPAGSPAHGAALDAAHWQQRLSELAELHGIPGATLGILRLGDEPALACHGVLNADTGVETTTDSLFQIGSITKPWTATVAMQLIDEGALTLDTRVVDVLPGFTLADADAAQAITVRHLLTHTSGIDGDVFTDTGRGDDCIEKYVASLAEVATTHPVGATFSYCNSGYVILGRVIEQLTGLSWDEALRQRIYAPLGLQRTGTLPEEALRHRAAFGHLGRDEHGPLVAKQWSPPRSLGPSGIINSTAGEVLEFARMHLLGGVAGNGTRILSEQSTTRMTEFQVGLPDPSAFGDSWGLGWIRFDWGGTRLFGHDGGTIGQSAILRVLPDSGLAVILMTNGGNTKDLYQQLFTEIFDELAGVTVPAPFAPPTVPYTADVARYVGSYRRTDVLMEVFEEDGSLRLRNTVSGAAASFMANAVTEFELVPVREDVFAIRPEGAQSWASVRFYSLPSGERYITFGSRATPQATR
ncbi:serine hydrolase [Leucobacter komagatae]|uniref:Beta-lactamase n=1 Tax=Leucobacter komagatae TaxID=55969 RepID=A0A0D0ILS2_9MICO|nr:serine hydrolase [Leucobacter komagatae]KIP52509.1 beta-lactamase [Leucobacter komagatae]